MGKRLKILAASRHPASAEALAPVVRRLRDGGHAVRLLAETNDTVETKNAGGAAPIFEENALQYESPAVLGEVWDPVDVSTAWADRMVQEGSPDVVLVGASYDPSGQHFGIEDALLLSAEHNGFPSIQVIDTIGTWFPRLKGGRPDRYAVENDFTRQVLAFRGADEMRIVKTGQPASDEVADEVGIRDADVRRSLDIGEDRLIAYFTQGDPDNRSVLSWLIDGLDRADRLVIARHPRDVQDYTDLVAAHPQVLTTKTDSHALLNVIDVCVTRYSSMGVKAALRGIPTINALLETDWADVRAILGGFPLALAGGSVEANSRSSLREALKFMYRPAIAALRSWYMIDGKSTDRVVGEVLAAGTAAQGGVR